MTTYFRGREVFVNDRYLAIKDPRDPHRNMTRYWIDEIDDAHIVRGDLHRVRVICGHTAAAAIGVVAVSWPFLDTPVTFFVAFVVLVIAAAIAIASWRLVPRVHEIRATYRTFEVCLYRSNDLTTFGQVARALQRSIERRRQRLEGFDGHSYADADR